MPSKLFCSEALAKTDGPCIHLANKMACFLIDMTKEGAISHGTFVYAPIFSTNKRLMFWNFSAIFCKGDLHVLLERLMAFFTFQSQCESGFVYRFIHALS